MPTTDRPRKRHAAQRSRWLTGGLAAAGTLGITGYLQFVHPPATTTISAASPVEAIAAPTAQIPVPAPPAPKAKVVTKRKSSSGSAGTVPSTPPATVAPVSPPAPQPQIQVRVQQQPQAQVTTRGSKG